MVRQVNTLGTNAINIAVSPVSRDEERQRLHERLARKAERERRAAVTAAPAARAREWRTDTAQDSRPCANDQCRSHNPRTARFCRRCGNVLA